MRNYNESDYAVNKLSPNIVYRFANGKVEITLADYLQSNPDKTEQDFAELKAWSDENYHEQVTGTNRTGRLDVSINELEGTMQLSTEAIDVELIRRGEQNKALIAAKQLLDSGSLTEVQQRRFILHFFKGLSTRQIASAEGVHQKAVWKSIHFAKEKLKTFFEN